MKIELKNLFLKLQLVFIPCRENNYRPKFLESRFLFFYFFILLALKLFLFFYIIYFPKVFFFADLSECLLIQTTNQERESLGLQPLNEDPRLREAAYFKALDIMTQDYFSHWNPQGKSPWYWIKLADYDYKYAGENLAIGFIDSQEVYRAWDNSPSHKKNLINPKYQDIGIAVLKGDFQGNQTYVVVQLFGTPKEKIESAAFVAQEKTTTSQATPTTLQEKPVGVTGLKGVLSEETDLGLFQFLSLNYSDLLSKILFYSLIFVIAALILNIFIRIDVQYPDLIVKTGIFILLLIILVYLDKETTIKLIPHHFRIF